MNQRIIDRVVDIATKAALDGHPVSGVTWIPPFNAADDPLGNFVVWYFVDINPTTSTMPLNLRKNKCVTA